MLLLACLVAGSWGARGERIADSAVVRVGFDPAWPPFSEVVAGKDEPVGIDIEIIRHLASGLGWEIEWVRGATWSEVWERFLAGEVDVTLGTAKSEARRELALFTNPYIRYPVALITRVEGPFLTGLRGFDGGRMAMPAGHVTTEDVARRFPGIDLLLVDHAEDALLSVARGDADVVVENLATASHIIRKRGLTNLKIAGLMDEEFTLRFAVRPERGDLARSLNLALAEESQKSRVQEIVDAWIPVDYRRAIRWQSVRRTVLWGVSVALPCLGLMWWWNRRLSGELAERHRVEAELRGRTEELKEANRRLELRQEEKEMFMRMVAHDLNNPLTTILLNAESMDEDAAGGDQRARAILEGSSRMSRMIRNLLHVDAVEHGAGWVSFSEIHPVPLVQRIIDRYLPLARKKDIGLQVEALAPFATRIYADPDALDQVVDNLLSNAIKYTERDHGITMKVDVVGTMFHISVRDEGLGIPEEDRAKLFSPYHRTRNQPTGGERSNGLGLAAVKLLVDLMKGRVWYEPHEEGSMFVVEFPRLG
ncbi:MAG TPA: transporter substrate-binding domain-containing protein [Kiritimatiellia bacterium]|nr:transporter substrate-binding domain-containing protein [Kiritimatiellia bacterium]